MRKIYLLLFAVSFLAITSNAQVTGVKTIGVDYPTLAAAVTALNTQGVGVGGATINVPAGYTETVPSGGLVLGSTVLNATLIVTNPLVFQKSGVGANPVLTAFTGGTSINSDGIWKFQGTDYVTVDGINVQENAANTGAALMEWGYAFVNLNAAAPFDGVQNSTIKNTTVTLDRTNPNGAFGIYSAHNIATNNTALTLTAVGDLHSNNKFYSNTIQNVNEGFWILGYAAAAPYTLYDQNNDVGGSSAATGNTLRTMGVTALFNTFCIYLVNQNGANASYNTIDNAAGGTISSTTQLIGIYSAGTTSTFTARNNNLLMTTTGGATITGGIYTASTGNVTLQNNTVAFVDAAGGSGTHYGLYSSAAATFTSTISNNNLTANTTGAVTGAYYFIYNNGAAATATFDANTINNVNISTTGTTGGIYNAAAPTVYNVTNNSITNFNRTAASGTHYGIYTGSPATGTFNQNMIDNVTFSTPGSTGTIYGIYDISSGVTMNYTNNTIRNLSTPSTGTLYGIREFGTTGNKTIQNNQVYNFSTSPGGAGGFSATGISWLTGGVDDVSNNQVYNINSTGTTGGTGGTIIGILCSGGTTNAIYKNKVYNLSSNSTAATIYGLQVTAGTTNNIYNNLIGDLRSPFSSSATDLMRGINITATTTNANQNVSFNTVYLNATSSGTNFSTTGLFHTTSATATTSNLNLRNNIIVNNSTAMGTGLTVAYRRSSTTLTNYGATSDRNLFFAGLPCPTNLIFYDGTNADQTLAAYKARVAPRDANSITEDPKFLSTNGSSANFLHIDPAIPTQIESAATPVAGITDDYDVQVRNVATPDIGADEFTGTVATVCGGTPTPGTAAATPATLCANQATLICLTGQSAGTGISIQWQSATALAGPFNNIACAGGNCLNTGALAPGTYYYRANVLCAGSGLSANSNVVTVVVNANPSLSVSPAAPSICAGGSGVSLTATGASTYTWSPATGLSATTGATVTANPAATTTYTVTGTNAAGCVSTTTVTVTVNPAPSISSITATPSSICAGGTTQLNAVASTNIQGYNINNVPFAPIASGSGTTVLASGGTAVTPMTVTTLDDGYWNGLTLPFPFTYFGTSYTTYNVQTNGIMSFSPFTTTTGYGNSPQMPNALVPNNILGVFGDMDWRFGGVISTYTSGTAPNRIFVINYDGSTGGGFYNAGVAPTFLVNYQIQLFENGNKIQIHTTSIASDASHNHTMGVEDATGLIANVVPGRDNSLWSLSNNGTEFSIPVVTYLWSPAGTLNNATIANPVASNVQNTTVYSLTVTSPNGCTATSNVTVTVNSPTVTGTIVQPTTCVATNGSINLTVTGGQNGAGPYTYAWTGNGVNPNSQNQSNLDVGTYSVVVTDVPSGCTRTEVFNLVGPGGCSICPTIPNLTVTPSPACANQNTTFSSTALTDMGVTYGVQFKYSPTALANPYTGGTILGTVANGALTAGNTTATFTGSIPTAGSYFVYAILSPTPTDPSCRPFAQANLTVNAAPTITCPANITISTDPNQCGAIVTYPAAVVTGTPAPTVTYSTPSGSLFPKGVTTVTATATNSCGTATCTFTVTVNDTQLPTITCPANITVSNTTGQCGANVTFSVTATDNCPGTTVVSSPASGSFFPRGTTTVTSTATDAAGNVRTCTFTVTVNDTQAPAITCPANITVNNTTGQCGANVSFTVTGTDNCPGVTITSAPASGSFFPVGTTTVTNTATDASGNVTTCTFTVRVNDTQLPVITCPANITVNTPVGSCTAAVTYAVTATDNCPGVVVARTAGPASGSQFPLGVTTVTHTATDASGNVVTCSFTVTVNDVQLPVISVQPSNRTVCSGTSATFSVTASNVVSYQWQQFNGTAFANIPGATASTYTVTNATNPAMNTNTFRVVLNGLCTVVTSNNATLFVNLPASVTLAAVPPPSITPGFSTTIVATVSTPGGTYQWFKNGQLISNSGSTLGPITVDDLGTYRVTYTDPNGCVATSADLAVTGMFTNKLWVYPNPNKGKFQVRYFNAPGDVATIMVHDALGQRVYRNSYSNTNTPYSVMDVDLGFKANGIYIVSLVNGAGKIVGSQRINVQKFQ